jgi:hypothetical protein
MRNGVVVRFTTNISQKKKRGLLLWQTSFLHLIEIIQKVQILGELNEKTEKTKI